MSKITRENKKKSGKTASKQPAQSQVRPLGAEKEPSGQNIGR